jgi:methionyl-tRNA formyltransferase
MSKLKIGYFADGPWSHMAFEKIIKDLNIEVKFIVPRFDTVDQTLYDYARQYNIDYFKLENVNSPESLDKIDSYSCDLLVSMSFNQIFKKDIIELSPLKIINCHAGKLPFYRGRNVLNWALINDEKEFGITVHFVDEGIDTGDLILQRLFSITDNDDYKSLLELSYKECASILYDALQLFISGNVNRIPQDSIHPLGSYCGRRIAGDEFINWNTTSREIFNFIRSISSPGPRAQTYLNNDIIKINSSNFLSNAPSYIGKPGQILAKTKNGYLVKTADSYIEIVEIDKRIKVGQQFGPKFRN